MESEALVLTSPYRVTSADADMHGRLKPSALLGFLVQSAIDSADLLGFGFKNLREQHLFWVLSRIHIELDCPLMWKESVEIETWPRDIEKILYRRDYLIRKGDQEMGRATSSWLAIDIESKRPGKISAENEWLFTHLNTKKAIDAAPAKLNAVLSVDENMIHPQFSDFDVNRHVTATRYVEWALNRLYADFQAGVYPKSITLNYIKETLPGENLKMRFSREGNAALCEAQNVQSGLVSFRCKMTF